jgi:pimeloyl-ACP methyl ester carboxylesterase
MRLNHHRGGSGEPIVLIHGIGSQWQVWGPVLPRLETERDVIAVDLPGFGASPPPAPGTPAGVASLTSLRALQAELLLPRQALRAAHEIPSARIVTLHGCGHVPTYDDPDQVASVLLDGSGQ